MTMTEWMAMDCVTQGLMLASRPNIPEGLAEAIRAERLCATWAAINSLHQRVDASVIKSPKIKRQHAELIRGIRILGEKPLEFWLDEQVAFGSPQELLRPIVNANI